MSRTLVCGCHEARNCKMGLVLASGLENSRFETRFHRTGPLRAKSRVAVKRHLVGVVRELGERNASSGVVFVIRPGFKITRYVPK
ncbi:hypothetical protein AVEN_21489-1 [Araneus ventricosus]|uniref:Uncharacterized protein n=1 Tax=Araneus ventricosus TaxID=182803 RepID=A0A4Y2EPE5_ARAVE|nr:hypothetical protein AVEN_21489-1 [Araneus ventricosus]